MSLPGPQHLKYWTIWHGDLRYMNVTAWNLVDGAFMFETRDGDGAYFPPDITRHIIVASAHKSITIATQDRYL